MRKFSKKECKKLIQEQEDQPVIQEVNTNNETKTSLKNELKKIIKVKFYKLKIFEKVSNKSNWNLFDISTLIFFFKLKIIEDPNINDFEIENTIKSMVTSSWECRKKLQNGQNGYDNYSLLHYAAKMCRAHLCEYLIDDLAIDVNSHSKIKMTPLHLMIKSNVFEKSNRIPDRASVCGDYAGWRTSVYSTVAVAGCRYSFNGENPGCRASINGENVCWRKVKNFQLVFFFQIIYSFFSRSNYNSF
jgi:hypothetical protein